MNAGEIPITTCATTSVVGLVVLSDAVSNRPVSLKDTPKNRRGAAARRGAGAALVGPLGVGVGRGSGSEWPSAPLST